MYINAHRNKKYCQFIIVIIYNTYVYTVCVKSSCRNDDVMHIYIVVVAVAVIYHKILVKNIKHLTRVYTVYLYIHIIRAHVFE